MNLRKRPAAGLLASMPVAGLLLIVAGVLLSGARALDIRTSAAVQDGPQNLSLVYLDASRADRVELWVAAHDGGDPRRVAELPPGARALAMSGALAAFNAGGRLIVVNLASGEQGNAELPQPARSAAFAGDGILLVATAGTGACAPDPLALPQPSRLIRFDIATGEATEIATVSGRLLDVLWASATTREAVVLPRGCDVGIGELRVHDIDSGELLRTAAVEGCGWVAVLPTDAELAVVGWGNCTVPDAHAGAVATLYHLRSGTARDIPGETNATIRGVFRFSPDGTRLAVGGFLSGIAGPRGSSTGAVWLVDPATLTLGLLAPGLGAEALPLDWSPDGRSLLVQATEAQGVCSFHIVDVETHETYPLSEAITHCGVNGAVLGWTRLG